MYSSFRAAAYYYQVSLSYTPLRIFASYVADCGSDDCSEGASQQQIHYSKSCCRCSLLINLPQSDNYLKAMKRNARADNFVVVDLGYVPEALGNISQFYSCRGFAPTKQPWLWNVHLYQPPLSKSILLNLRPFVLHYEFLSAWMIRVRRISLWHTCSLRHTS